MSENLLITLPNVSYAEAEAIVSTAYKKPFKVTTINSFIRPLIEKLAIRHPDWTFLAIRDAASTSNCTIEVCAFEMFVKQECIGRLNKWYSYHSDSWLFSVTNDRIKEKAKRGDSIRSKSIDTTVKTVEKYCSPLGLTELFSKAAGQAGSKLEMLRDRDLGRVSQLWREGRVAISKFVLDNWDAYTATASEDEREILLNLPEHTHAAALTSDVYHNYSRTRGNAYMVYLQGDKYVTNDKSLTGGAALTIKTHEELTEGQRHKIGMLKLVEDNTTLEGIGFRSSATSFIIYGDKNV